MHNTYPRRGLGPMVLVLALVLDLDSIFVIDYLLSNIYSACISDNNCEWSWTWIGLWLRNIIWMHIHWSSAGPMVLDPECLLGLKDPKIIMHAYWITIVSDHGSKALVLDPSQKGQWWSIFSTLRSWPLVDIEIYYLHAYHQGLMSPKGFVNGIIYLIKDQRSWSWWWIYFIFRFKK